MRPRDLKVAGAAAASSCGSRDGLEVDASSGDGILGIGWKEKRIGWKSLRARVYERLPIFSKHERLFLDHMAARVPDPCDVSTMNAV